MLNPYTLIVAAMLALTGCAMPERPAEPPPPAAAAVSEETWQQVEQDIHAASRSAAAAAKAQARAALDEWRDSVRRHTENDFIPWFSGYWTQQWLAVKMAWYRLRTEEGGAPAATRLSAYLQTQYRERVLVPAARDIDPDTLLAQATQRYLQLLGEGIEGIPPRHGIAGAQLDHRLRDIPAIALAPPASHDASLYQLVHAEPIARQPAYAALLARIRKAAQDADNDPMAAGISPMARRTGDKLAGKLAASGGASAAAAVFGGVAGMMISLGAAGFGAVAHANEQPKMEAELRASLNAAQDEMYVALLEDAGTGVLAGVYQIAGRIEAHLAEPRVRPVSFEPVQQKALPSGD